MAEIDLACGYVFQGTGKTLSGSCTNQFECAGATDGSIICDAQLSVCATKKTVNGGDPCNGVGDHLPAGLHLHPEHRPAFWCARRTRRWVKSCAAISCDHTTRCVDGTCAALAQSGEACTVTRTAPRPRRTATTTSARRRSARRACWSATGPPARASGRGWAARRERPTGTAGAGGSWTGAAGSAGGAGGRSTGAAGAAGGAGGASTGAAGAAGGAGGGVTGAAGALGGGGAGAGGALSDSTGVGGI